MTTNNPSQPQESPSLSPHEAAIMFFHSNGWKPEQAIGIVANFHHEGGGLNPDAVGDGGKSFGVGQWNGPRRERLFQYAVSKGEKTPSLPTQLEFAQWELDNTERTAGDALRQTRTVEEATKVFSDKYERPGKPMMQSRLQIAKDIFGRMFSPSEAQAATIPVDPQPTAAAGSAPVETQESLGIPRKSKSERAAEAYRLGLMGPKTKARYEDAIRMGIVKGTILTEEANPANSDMMSLPSSDINFPGKLKRPYSDEQLAKVRGMSRTDKFFTGVGAGLTEFVRGLEQAGTAATKQDELNQYVTEKGMQERKELAPLMATAPESRVGKFVGQTLPVAAIPQAVPESLAARAAIGAVTGAGLGATSFVEPGESRGMNAAVGGAAGAGGALALGAVNAPVNMVKGPPDTLTRQLSKKWGIRTTLAEDLEGMSSRTDVIMERVPVLLGGRKNWRYAQREEAHNATKSAIGKFMVNPADDIGSSSAYEANRDFADSLFQSLRGLVGQVQNQEISPSSTKPIVESLLDRFPDVFKTLQDKRVERILQDIRRGTADTPAKVVRDPNTGFPMTVPSKPTTLTFDEAWELRKGLGDLIGMARKKELSGDVHREALGQFKAMFGAISDDIDRWAASIGRNDISDALRTANGAYKDYVVKYDILQRAYDKATKNVGDDKLFSPAKFANELERIASKEKYVHKFTPNEMEELTGLANILQVVKRGGQYLENPPTGNRWGPLTLAGGAEGFAYHAAGLGGALKTAGMAAASGWINRFLTTTEAGKRLATSAAKIAPVSPAMNKIVTEIYKQVPKFAAEMSQVDLPKAELGESIPVDPSGL